VWIERVVARVTDVLLFTNPVIRDVAEAERIRGRRASVVVGAPLRS